jgi:hypothetical protein
LVRGPSLAAAGGALLGRRMGGSPRLLKRGTTLMEDAAAGKMAEARIVQFSARRCRPAVDTGSFQDLRGRDQMAGRSPQTEPEPENSQFRGVPGLRGDIECEAPFRKQRCFLKRHEAVLTAGRGLTQCFAQRICAHNVA